MQAHSGQQAIADGARPAATIRVWDLFVRVFHWSLVVAFVTAFISAEEWDRVHEYAGYVAAGLVTMRVVWGFIGSKHARFADFVRGPLTVLGYLGDVLTGRERRTLGHNPAGGAMILALLAGIVTLGVTGYMLTLDAYWGVEWLEDLHELVASGMLVLVALHVAGVVIESLRHGENLIWAMITGQKRAPDAGDIA